MGTATWTDERKELLRQLRAEDPPKSYSECAKILGGFDHTRDGGRSAVGGMCDRLGIPKSGRRAYVGPRKPRFLRGTKSVLRPLKRRVIDAIDALAAAKFPDEPTAFQCSLIDLPENGCHWPVTADRPFLFCGSPRHAESSYCTHHFMRSLKQFETAIVTVARAVVRAKAA